MSNALRVLGWLALAGTIVPSVMYLGGRVSLVESQTWLLVATVAWFAMSFLRYPVRNRA